MRATPVTFPANDGSVLSGTAWEPAVRRAAVVVAGATAVPARAYAALAEALGGSGLAVLTFDYRGVGGSASGRLRGDRTVMADWGRLDLDAALAWMLSRHPGQPLLLLGHSVGGQLLGLAPTAEALRGALLVGSQGGYWRNWSGLDRLRAWAGWHVVLPAASTVLGYTPMRALGMGEDLPAGVGLQWARWGRHPDYLLSECTPAERERYRRLGFPSAPTISRTTRSRPAARSSSCSASTRVRRRSWSRAPRASWRPRPSVTSAGSGRTSANRCGASSPPFSWRGPMPSPGDGRPATCRRPSLERPGSAPEIPPGEEPGPEHPRSPSPPERVGPRR